MSLALGNIAAARRSGPPPRSGCESTIAALEDAATQERYAPRRPAMLPRLMSAANNENVSRRELASIIARDPSLVGSLLKIANSSYYRVTPAPVESVDRALALLGTDGLRSLVSTALMQPIFRIAGASFPRFPEIAWEHTFRAASAAVPYAVIVEKSDPFAAELLSLLLGLARIVDFSRGAGPLRQRARTAAGCEPDRSLLDSQSVPTARRIGASWELTERTLSALGSGDATANEDSAASAAPQETSDAGSPSGEAAMADAKRQPSGSALEFGRIVGALAVLRIYRAIDSETGRVSLPSGMPVSERDRMWTRLTAQGIKA